MLPNKLIIGPQKAGTSWIHEYLQAQPNVSLPHPIKETFFFDRYYHRGIQWYQRHFPPVTSTTTATIEVAPSYFHSPAAPERIRRALGEIPLLITLREPVARTYSLYLHMRRYGKAPPSLRQAIQEDPMLLESSRYATILRRWIDVFGTQRISALFLEDLRTDPGRYAAQLCRELDVPYEGVSDDQAKPVNQASTPPVPGLARVAKSAADVFRHFGLYRVVETAKLLGLKPVFFGQPGKDALPAISEADRAWLFEELRDEIDALEQLLGICLEHWKRDGNARAA